MHYFLDGYNMLFRLVHDEKDLQSQRESFIHDLNKKISLLNLNVSIVFDAAFRIGERSRSHYNALEILYSAEGETADNYILDELKNISHPRQVTVVTSDKNLARLARCQSVHTESVEEFIQWLNRVYKNKLRLVKKGTQAPASPEAPPIAKKDVAPRSRTPPKDAPLEAYADYYAQVFESQWQGILEEEKQQQNAPSPQKRAPRRPRPPKDPFAEPQTPEERAATEMERWLKAFEKRLNDKTI